MSPVSVTGILLAAGQGKRFGSDKLLHPLANGQPLGLVAAASLQAVCVDVIAVLRPAQVVLAEQLVACGVRVVWCADADQGMGHSLAAGIAASAESGAWLVALADMPYVLTSTLQSLVAALQAGASIVAPSYQGQRGNPVGFASHWKEALQQIKGDQGARALVQANSAQLHLIECDDPGIHRDIDRLADLSSS